MEVTDVTGNFGRWQLWVTAIMFYLYVLGAMENLSITFFAPNIAFRCIEPFASEWNNATSGEHHMACRMPLHGNSSTNGTYTKCKQWEYDTSQFPDNIVGKWDLVCDREWLVSLSKSIYMAGYLISVIMFGQISDWIGRFPTIIILYCIICASMFISLLSNSYAMFASLRFFQAFGSSSLLTVGCVLVTEIVGSDHRMSVNIVLQLAWSVGYLALGGVAYFVRPWFWLQLVISLPFLPVVFAYWFVPESPRWLQIKGKWEKLEKVLIKAARINKKEIKADLKESDIFKADENDSSRKSRTFLDLVKTPNIRNKTFTMTYIWMVVSFMYYGVTYNINDLAGDLYINFMVMGALELPSYVFLYWSTRRFGRRSTLAFLMGVTACFCAAAAIAIKIDTVHLWIGTALAMGSMFCLNAAFTLLYLYTNEIYPTVVRNVALGSCSMFARAGAIAGPFVKELGKVTHPSVPNILYSVLALTSTVLSLVILPETSGQKLQDTLDEGEAIEKFCSCCLWHMAFAFL